MTMDAPRDTSTTTHSATASGEVGPSQPRAVVCPFCRSTETELLSLFGSQLSTTQYYCRACHTPFEYMKQNPQPEP